MDTNEIFGPDGTRAGQGDASRESAKYYLGLPYTIELWRAPEGGWVVQVKELPGCVSQGETAEEALEMIQDAMQGWLEVALEMGDAIPEPRAEENYSGKFVVRMPRSLHRQLVERADREDASLNQYVTVALAYAVGANQPVRAADTAAAVAPRAADPLWPGLSSVLYQVLASAGYRADAGALDEHLFAEWFAKMLAQVEAAVKGEYGRDALAYLDAMIGVLQSAANRSPVVASLCGVTLMLRRQIENTYAIQRGVLGQLRLSVSSYALETNSILAQQLMPEERAPSPFEPAVLGWSEKSAW